jgi:hypothetical protein
VSQNVKSLLEERRGYVARGLKDRIAQVDAQLARLGFVVEDEPAAPAVETADAGPAETTAKPSGRKRA